MGMSDRKEIIRGLYETREFFSYGLLGQHPTSSKYQQILTDAISLIKEQEPMRVLSQRECETLPNHYERKGFCPKCNQTVEWFLNRSYCGFCGQGLKWND